MIPFFDPLYLIIIAPAILLALWAQYKVHHTYNQAKQIPTRTGISGAEAARHLLDVHGLRNVTIEMAQGFLSDHYDPRHKVLRLSPENYQGHSLAAVGIAAHEAGHAIQDVQRYAPLVVRNGLVPMAMAGGQLTMILLLVGTVLMVMGSPLGWWAAVAGVALFGVTVVFQLVNLPVEFDASRRAKMALVQYGIVSEQEMEPVRKVLSAAALTYVAATLTAVLQLLYWLLRLGLLGGGQEE